MCFLNFGSVQSFISRSHSGLYCLKYVISRIPKSFEVLLRAASEFLPPTMFRISKKHTCKGIWEYKITQKQEHIIMRFKYKFSLQRKTSVMENQEGPFQV